MLNQYKKFKTEFLTEYTKECFDEINRIVTLCVENNDIYLTLYGWCLQAKIEKKENNILFYDICIESNFNNYAIYFYLIKDINNNIVMEYYALTTKKLTALQVIQQLN